MRFCLLIKVRIERSESRNTLKLGHLSRGHSKAEKGHLICFFGCKTELVVFYVRNEYAIFAFINARQIKDNTLQQ